MDIRSPQCYFRVCQSGKIWNKKAFFLYILNLLLYKTNRFHVAVHLFSNRSKRTSKCGKNISDTLSCTSYATFLFLPHFDVICDLLPYWTDARQHEIYLLIMHGSITLPPGYIPGDLPFFLTYYPWFGLTTKLASWENWFILVFKERMKKKKWQHVLCCLGRCAVAQ